MEDAEYKNYEKLFYNNLQLFLDNYDKIINEPKFSNILWPHRHVGSMYFDLEEFKRITLGSLLTIFKNEKDYVSTCPDCGEKSYLVFSVVSPLSGIVYKAKLLCSACSKTVTLKNYKGIYGAIRRCCREAVKQDQDVEPFHITELINFFKNEVPPNENCKENVYYNSYGSGGVVVNKKFLEIN